MGVKERYKNRNSENSAEEKKRFNGVKERWTANNINDISDNLTSRINTWIESSNNYIANYQNRLGGRTGTYKDSYVSDSDHWMSRVDAQRRALDREAESIKKTLSQYGDYFNSDWLSEVTSVFDKGKKTHESIVSAATSDRDYWAQWDEESYGKWQRESGYADKYKGKKYDELNEILGKLDEGTDEHTWLSDYAPTRKWAEHAEATDFDQYSSAGASIKNPSYMEAQGNIFKKKQDVGNIVTFSRENKDAIAFNADNYSQVGTWKYNLMTDDEVNMYNYLLSKYGSDKATEYLTDIDETLNERHGEFIKSNIDDIDSFLGRTVTKGVFSLGAGIDQAVSGLRQAVTAKDLPTTPTAFANQAIMSELDGVGKYAYQAGNTIGNMLPSIAVSALTGSPAAGAAMMGVSSSGNAYSQARDEGYDEGQARLYGALVGASEGALQYALGGISKLSGASNVMSKVTAKTALIDNALLRVAAKYGTSLSGEIVEEELQNFLEPLFKTVIFGEEYDAPTIEELLETAIVTALSTGVLESGGIIGGEVNNRQYKDTYGEVAPELVTEALEIDPSNTYAQKVQARLDAGKSITGNQIANLIEQNEAAMAAGDVTAIETAARERLTALGETGDVAAISTALAKQASGEKLGVKERSLVKNSKFGQRVANELNVDNIKSGQYSSSWAESIGTNRINADEYNRLEKAAEVDGGVENAVETTAEAALPKSYTPETTTPVEGEKTASTEAVDLPEIAEPTEPATDTNVPTTEKGPEQIENAEEVRETANAADTNVGHNEPITIEEASQAYGKHAEAMRIAYNAGDGSQDVVEFDAAYKVAYDMGKSGVPFDYVTRSEATAYLNERQRELAYETGKSAADVDAATLDSSNKALANGKTGRKIGAVRGDGVTIEDLKATFNDRQNTAYKVLSTIAEVTGIDIVLYKSDYTGAQGRYDRSEPGTVYIDINAGVANAKSVNELAKYTMLRTFSHEFTHFIENWNPVRYNEFRKAVFDTLTERGEDVNGLIEAKMEGSGLSYDRASREVIAEAMTDILPDAGFVETLATKHKSIFEKLKEKLGEFLSAIKEYFNSIARNSSREANALKEQVGETVRYVESIVKLFDNVAVEAVENYQLTVAGDLVPVAAETEAVEETEAETVEEVAEMSEAEVVEDTAPTVKAEETAKPKSKKAKKTSLTSLIKYMKKASRDNLRGAYTITGKESKAFAEYGVQYMSDGIFAAAFSTADESLEQNNSFPLVQMYEILNGAKKNEIDGYYVIDEKEIASINRTATKKDPKRIKVGDALFDVKYVDALIRAFENPQFSLYNIGNRFKNKGLRIVADNGSAVLMPIMVAEKDATIAYEAQAVGDDLAGVDSAAIKAELEKRAETGESPVDKMIEQATEAYEAEQETTEQPTNEGTPSEKLANALLSEYLNGENINRTGKALTSKELYALADKAFGGTQAEGVYDRKDAYDALELAVNKFLLKEAVNLNGDAEVAVNAVTFMQKMLERLPTQNVRTQEMEDFQQFSTPPNIAYLAAWAANINDTDMALEPSAGIGGLAVFAKAWGAEVAVNELSKRRLEVLRSMGFDHMFNENAEHIDDILPDDISPSVVIMNPPFSSTAGRTKNNKTSNAEKHIDTALARLRDGGRLVAILGKGMNDADYYKYWDKLRKTYNIRANISVDGENYKKYGTTYDVQIVVIDKTGPQTGETVTGRYTDLTQIPNVLEGIRNDRSSLEANRDRSSHDGIRESVVDGGNSGISDTGNTGSNQSARRSSPDVQRKENRKSTKRDGGLSDSEGLSQVGGEKAESDNGGTAGGVGRTDIGDGNGVSESSVSDRPEPELSRPVLNEEISDDGVYSTFVAPEIPITGGKRHPAVLVESAAMAAVSMPKATYKPSLPDSVVKNSLSDAQLVTVTYAGQAHEQLLPDGRRKGFFVGDGTGVGKGRQIAGIILDNFMQGRNKAVWISKNNDLYGDAIRDWTATTGRSKDEVVSHNKIKSKDKITLESGILYSTYDTLKSEKGGNRLDQIVEWLGEDFDGVIAFDEAHNMGNLFGKKGKFGKSKGSDKARAGVELQRRLPKARIVYVSATAATEVDNLAYAERIGLWGQGTAFSSAEDFISKIGSSGLAAMELVIRDMKAMGVYVARSISYNGVNYDTVEHSLDDMQTEIYNTMSRAWQKTMQNVQSALETTGGKYNSTERQRAMGNFYSSMQRFYNQVLTSMSMPSVIADMRREIAEGHSCVLQIVNTNEAQQNKQLAEAKASGESLDDLDLTPREALIGYLNTSFPVQMFEEYTDDDGNTRSRPVYDSAGNPVQNKAAIRQRDALIAEVEQMSIPDGPLEMLFDAFGPEAVAENTGRSRRVVPKKMSDGTISRVEERRTLNHRTADVQAFQDGKKRILVFSDAGGTGKSYHADRTEKNQQLRIHYVLQPGWVASNAVQGFGRTHRSNEASAPVYKLVTTNIKGQKRFTSTIARRLDQLGALTKGQRDTGSGMFGAKDNLETDLAKDSLREFYKRLGKNQIEGVDGMKTLDRLGLKQKFTDEYGGFKLNDATARDIGTFLNRILALEVDEQNVVFDAFIAIYEMELEAAINAGTLDTGMENVKADKVEVVDDKVIRQDKNTGAETHYIQAKTYTKPKIVTTVAEMSEKRAGFVGLYRINDTDAVRAVFRIADKTTEWGAIQKQYRLLGPNAGGKTNVWNESTLEAKAQPIEKAEWQKEWDAEVTKVPEYNEDTLHMLTGALLPIWNSLPQEGNTKVKRLIANNGDTYLGRVIDKDLIDGVLRGFSIGRTMETFTASEVMDKAIKEGTRFYLTNDRAQLFRSRVSGEWRLEITAQNSWYLTRRYPGIIQERIAYRDRYFIPVGEKGTALLEKLISDNPVRNTAAEDDGAQYQSREYSENTKAEKYSYEWFSEKPDMKITEIASAFPQRRTDVITEAKKNAASVGKRNGDGSVSVYVDDIGVDVVLGTNGLKHGLDRRFRELAPVTLRAGEIIKNSIRINEMAPSLKEAERSYILIGTAKAENGDFYVVRSVINRFNSELASMEVLYAINAKKSTAVLNAPRVSTPGYRTTISIAELLDYVNRYFPGILPNNVLKHYGHDERPKGEFSDAVMYQERSEALTDREVLEIAASEIEGSLTDGERAAYEIFQKRLEKLRQLEEERAEQGRIYRENTFVKGGDKKAAEEAHNRMGVLNSMIQKANEDVLSVEDKAVLRRVLVRARKVVEDAQRAHDDEKIKRLREKQKEAIAVKKYRERIKADTNELSKWILRPDGKDAVKRVPDVLKNAVIPFLTSIDFTSAQQLRGGDATKADQEFAKRLIALQGALKTNVNINGLYSGYNDLPPDFLDNLQNFVNTVQTLAANNKGEYVINKMTAEELHDLSKIVKTLKKFIMQINRFHANAMYQHVYEAADNSIEYLAELAPAKGTGAVSNFMLWQQMRPAYAFERFGRGGIAIYDGLRRGQGKLAFNTKDIKAFAESAYTEAEVKAWEKETKAIKLPSGVTVRMNVSQIMGLYELSKQEDSLRHMLGGGIRVATFKNGKEVISDVGRALTEADISTIVSTLTQRQKEVADALQRYMATKGAEWGNYVSMARFGEELFTNPQYYPINSDGRHLQAKGEEAPGAAALYALLNMSFTKSRVEGANNRIILYSIFDVFSNHMASMAQYNAMALPVLDALKWFNYQQVAVDGEGNRHVITGVREQMDRAYGTPEETRPGSGNKGYAESFVYNIIKAFNGTEAQGTPNDSLGLKSLHQYNRAQIAYNTRVVMQQPLAITRAGMLLDYSSIIKALKVYGQSPKKRQSATEEMRQHSGIAAWKELGFYDVNVSRGIASIIKHDESALDKITDFGMKAAENADIITWTAMWTACKEEVTKKQKLKPTDEGYFEAVTKLFEDVIYKTQVVDSILTKNEFMRDKGFFARSVGSFMSEPTTTASMLIDAYDKFNTDMQRGMNFQQAWRRNGKMIARTAYVYGMGAVLLAAVQAVADALRDDDEYKTFFEKWAEAFGGNVFDELMPVNKLPIISDFYEVSKELLATWTGLDIYGNAPQSVFMQWYDSLAKGATIMHDKIVGEDTNYTLYGGIYKLLQAVSGMTGLPIGAVTREVVTIWNNTIGAMAPSLKAKSYDAGEKANIKYAYADGYLTDEEATELLVSGGLVKDANEAYLLLRGWKTGESTYEPIYKAVKNGGDIAELTAELTSHGYTEKQIKSQIAEKVGAWYRGTDSEPASITKADAVSMLQKYTDYTDDEITEKVNKWSAKVVTGVEYDDIDDKFLAGEITAARAKQMFKLYGGVSDEDAAAKVTRLSFVKENPELEDISSEAVALYNENCKNEGISPRVFYDAWKYKNATVGDDKKKKVKEYIYSLNLTAKQKRKLFSCFYKD